MLITIVFEYVCTCGTANSGVMCHKVRVNKGSIKSVANDVGLGFMPGTCKDCKAVLPTTARRYVQGDDLAKVNAARERKGWPPLDSGELGTVQVVRPGGVS